MLEASVGRQAAAGGMREALGDTKRASEDQMALVLSTGWRRRRVWWGLSLKKTRNSYFGRYARKFTRDSKSISAALSYNRLRFHLILGAFT